MKSFVVALLCVIGIAVPVAHSQMTTVAATDLRIGSTPIAEGTVCAVAVDATENAISVSIGGGGIQGVGQSCANIVDGTITTTVDDDPFQVADEALAGNPGFGYTFTITDTASKKSFQLHKVLGVTGTTFLLDHYVPTTSASTAGVFSFTTGVGAPVTACAGKSFYQDNTTPASPVLYSCGTDKAFHIITGSGGGGSVTYGTTAGTAAQGNDSRFAANAAAAAAAQTTANAAATPASVTSAVAAEATLARNASNLSSGTVALARIPTGTSSSTVALGDAPAAAQAAAIASAASTAVQKAGGTMTGLLLLSADPSANLGAATKQYVDSHASAGTDFVGSGTGHAHGLVPDPGATAGTTKFLREDGTFQVPAGSGNLADPGGNGLVYRTSLNTTAPATASQIQTTLSSDTVNNTSLGFATGSGGDSTCPTPITAKDFFCMKGGQVNYSHNGVAYVPLVAPSAYATLTDGATITWATGGAVAANAVLTLVHTTSTRTLNVSGLVNGAGGTLILKEDSTGVAGTFNLGTGCTWYVGGSAGFTVASTVTLTSTASAINILAFTYDGTNCYVNLR